VPSMGWWIPALAFVVIGAGACASHPTPSDMLKQAPIDPALHVRQPATIEEVIGGRKYTGYVGVTYGEADRIDIASRPPAFASLCKQKMRDWNADGRPGRAPCATVTLELDGDPPNFWVAGYWSAAPAMALSAALMRQSVRPGAGFVPGVGGSATATIVASPAFDAIIDSMARMYRDLIEVVGAPTPEACDALRPRNDDSRLGDGHCRPARLDIN